MVATVVADCQFKIFSDLLYQFNFLPSGEHCQLKKNKQINRKIKQIKK